MLLSGVNITRYTGFPVRILVLVVVLTDCLASAQVLICANLSCGISKVRIIHSLQKHRSENSAEHSGLEWVFRKFIELLIATKCSLGPK